MRVDKMRCALAVVMTANLAESFIFLSPHSPNPQGHIEKDDADNIIMGANDQPQFVWKFHDNFPTRESIVKALTGPWDKTIAYDTRATAACNLVSGVLG